MLVRLIYASTATEGVGLTEFKGILQQSQINNQRRDLTGVLAFNSKIFLQGLEGSREQVNELYSRLLIDRRHHTVAILEYAEIDEREWVKWSMGFAAPSADNRAVFLKYSGQSSFNPYGMRGSAVKKMLGELAGKSITMGPASEREESAALIGSKSGSAVTSPAALASSAPKEAGDSGFLGRLLNR